MIPFYSCMRGAWQHTECSTRRRCSWLRIPKGSKGKGSALVNVEVLVIAQGGHDLLWQNFFQNDLRRLESRSLQGHGRVQGDC